MKCSLFQEASILAESLLRRSHNLAPFFKCLYDHIFCRVEKVQVFQIKGLVKNTNYSATTLFVGGEESAYDFACLVYSQIESMFSLGTFLSCQIDPSCLPDAEIIAVNVNKPLVGKFLKQGYLLLPVVSFSLNLCRSMDSIIQRSSRRRRRGIKKLKVFNYSYKICRNNEKEFDFFYWNMYLPYVKKRFGKAAFLKDYFRSKALYLRNGGILFVKKEEGPVAGILFQIREKTLYAVSLGIYNGDQNFMKDLAGQAALFFLIEWAKMQGMKSLDYGGTVPFFRNGIFMYKKEWGMLAEAVTYQTFCALKLNSPNKGSLSFFQQNPFIFIDRGVMKGIFFLNHKPTTVELQQIISEHFLPELDSLIVIAYSSPSAEPINITESSTTSQNLPDALAKPLLSICMPLRKRGFNVELFACTHQTRAWERWGITGDIA